MAFARHNIEKKRLIELVKMNPILWDCRLPQYKRSDKKKAIKWDELGRIFSVNGERVQRTFTSLREIFRREFNHEKTLGNRFKSKWEYYDAMAFLKEVIRERKPRERSKRGVCENQHLKSHTPPIDEYQYFAPNDPNNPNNQFSIKSKRHHVKNQIENANCDEEQQQQEMILQQALQQGLQQSSSPTVPLQMQPDVVLNINTNIANGSTSDSQSLHQSSQSHIKHSSPNILSLSPSTSSSPSIYIKDEPDYQDDTISLATTNGNSILSKHLKNKRLITRLISSGSKKASEHTSKNTFDSDLVLDDEILSTNGDDDDPDLNDDNFSGLSVTSLVQQQPSPREILYNKFGDFLAARLNTLNETVANDLMNKILLLIAEK